jgi:hypothetical protein
MAWNCLRQHQNHQQPYGLRKFENHTSAEMVGGGVILGITLQSTPLEGFGKGDR